MNEENKRVIDIFNRNAEKYAELTFLNLLQYELNRFIALIPKNSYILDVGCGSGRDVAYFMEEKLNAIGIDASEAIIKEAKKRVDGDFRAMDMTVLEFKDENFDGVWALDAVSYLNKEEVKKALAEFNRVLKRDGILFISVREGNGRRKIIQEELGEEIEITFFSKSELEDLLKNVGFEVIDAAVEDSEDYKWVNIYAKKK